MIDVPEVVVNKARSLGAEAWLTDLGRLVAGLQRDWGIVVGQPYGGGTEGWVAEAVDDRGRPAVLKLGLPRPGPDPFGQARREIAVLDQAGGRGCASLYRHDADRGAILLERLGPSLADLNRPFAERLDILCRVAADLWTPIVGLDLPTGSAKAADLAQFIETTWEELDQPCSQAAVASALAATARRAAAHDDERSVLVHGDVHQWNTLLVKSTGIDGGVGVGVGWKLIDPDGLIAEAEYDLGVILREDPEESMLDIERGDPRLRARFLADRTGTDPDATWDWGLAERVSTGLLATRIDLQPVGAEMLAVADRLADLDRRQGYGGR